MLHIELHVSLMLGESHESLVSSIQYISVIGLWFLSHCLRALNTQQKMISVKEIKSSKLFDQPEIYN